jgi:tripartite-type tricarboxylate transporter receptor subunit TctC
VGHDYVAKAAPDGYTLLFSAAGPLTVTPHTYAKLPYDPIKSFEPIKLIASAPLVLEVRPSLPVNSVADLIRLAKAQPGKLTYASFGNGSAAHLAGELFKSVAGVDIVHVPYKGSAPALTDLLGGQVDMMFDVVVSSLPHIDAGKLRALAVTSDARLDLLPKVPTVAEAGVKDVDASTWFGLLAPAGTDKQVVNRLSAALDEVLQQPEIRKTLASQGALTRGGTPEDFRKFFLSEYERWGKVVKAAGIKAG